MNNKWFYILQWLNKSMGYLINLPQCEICGENAVPGEMYCKKHLKKGAKSDIKRASSRIFEEPVPEEPDEENWLKEFK